MMYCIRGCSSITAGSDDGPLARRSAPFAAAEGRRYTPYGPSVILNNVYFLVTMLSSIYIDKAKGVKLGTS